MAKQKNQNVIMAALLGKWMGHPLHPAVVHVPIAFWVGALIFDVLNLCGVAGNSLVRTSYWAILLGLIATAIVIPAGIAEWTQIKRERPAWRLALWHFLLNVTVEILLIISVVLRSGAAYGAQRVGWGAFGLIVAANAVLLVSGYIGGRMVYDNGIAVARMSKKKWRAAAAEGQANLPAEP